jgi:hypothetical protein
MGNKIKLVANRKVTISLTDVEYQQFYAYALVKGYGAGGGIASLARTAIVDKISRNAPTEAQQNRINEIISKGI